MLEVPHGGAVPDVRTLLQRHLDATGEKQADVVARAQRQGHQLSQQALSKLAKGETTTPKPDTVRALAIGLRTTERIVWLSIGATLGLDVGAASMADRIGTAADDISPEVLDSVEMLLRALTREASRHPYDPGVSPQEPGEDEPRVVRWPKAQAPSQRRTGVQGRPRDGGRRT